MTSLDASYDYIVVGGGSGGIASARRAASLGAKVALIERHALGGTCVNVGCVPKKVMFNAASLAEAFHIAPDYAFEAPIPRLDWKAFKQKRDAYVGRLVGLYSDNLEGSGVDVLMGDAHFEAGPTVVVGERRLTAPHVLIAVGGSPYRPVLPGSELGLISDQVFELEQMPSRICIVGAGYVAVEFAGIFRALGSEVALVARGSRLLRHFEEVLGEQLARCMTQQGIELHMGKEPLSLSRGSTGQLAVTLDDGEELDGFEQVLWGTGRRPATHGLHLERCGVRCDPTGYVVVDEYQNSSQSGIYAVGDVTGRYELTPVAIAAGRRLAHRLFGNEPESRLEYENIPSVVFSHPPAGSVGLSEKQAKERYASVKTYTSTFTNLFFALSDVKQRTSMKLVVVGNEERVVGAHVIGMGADEMLQGFAVAVRMGARKEDLDRTVAIHPTAAEEFVTMR